MAITLTVRGPSITIEVDPEDPVEIHIRALTSSNDGGPVVPFTPHAHLSCDPQDYER